MRNGILLFLLWMGGAATNAQSLVVWPGDANNNGVVNNIDLLHLGLGYNFFGIPRAATNTEWAPQPATPWSLPSAIDSLNQVYADCNGDGVINYLYDAFPIYVHYGKTHGIPHDETFTPGVSGVDVPIYLERDPVQPPVGPGDMVELSLGLGTSAFPAEDFYGIAFSILIDTLAVDVDQIQLDFSDVSWANPDFDRIHGTYRASSSRLDVAWVRTDRNNRDGFGTFGKVRFIIIDDVISLQQPQFELRIDSIRMIDRFGNIKAVAGDTLQIPVNEEVLEAPAPGSGEDIKLQMNLEHSRLLLDCSERMDQVRLFNMSGRMVAMAQPFQQHFEWSLPVLPGGLYVCEVMAGEYTTRKKLFIK